MTDICETGRFKYVQPVTAQERYAATRALTALWEDQRMEDSIAQAEVEMQDEDVRVMLADEPHVP